MKKVLEILSCIALVAGCTDPGRESTGATSETTNGVAVMVVDGANKPLPRAQVKVYSKANISVVDSSISDTLGLASFPKGIDGCTQGNCFVEGIAGEDSSLMSWSQVDFVDSSVPEIALLPSASLTVRTGASAQDTGSLSTGIQLESTPYFADLSGSDYVFAHVPAGLFTVVAGDSTIADVALEPGTEADTLVHLSGITREFVFDDFDDGDSLNNLAKTYPNYGWYYAAHKGAHFERPDSINNFTQALVDDSRGKYLSARYSTADSGYVMFGTHLGLDSGYYDMSGLTAIRIKVRGDCRFAIALEHYREIVGNNYNKALWHIKATEEWTEVILRPGAETLNDKIYQVAWDDISHEIGIFSIFIFNGSRLDIDDIVFEGISKLSPPENP